MQGPPPLWRALCVKMGNVRLRVSFTFEASNMAVLRSVINALIWVLAIADSRDLTLTKEADDGSHAYGD